MSMPVRMPSVSAAPAATPTPTIPACAARLAAVLSAAPIRLPAFRPSAPTPVIWRPMERWKLLNLGATRTVAAPTLATLLTVPSPCVAQHIFKEAALLLVVGFIADPLHRRSEERRVGKESTIRVSAGTY